jgi:hypothetical protein
MYLHRQETRSKLTSGPEMCANGQKCVSISCFP